MILKNILITASNGDLAEAVTGVLEDSFPEINIFGCESGDLWPAKVLIKDVFKVPRGDSLDYITEINKIVKINKIDLIIPCSDAELLSFSLAKVNKEIKCKLLMPNCELVNIFSDKYLGSEWLRKNNIASPKTYLLSAALDEDLPLIIKPRFGSGSQGIYKAHSQELLAGLKVEYGNTYIAQEYLDYPDREFTCALFKMSNVTRILIMNRRLDAGRTVVAEIIKNDEVELFLMNLIKITNLNGLLNVQLRLTDNGPKIFEINPRVSSTVKMRHMLGFCDLVWAIKSMKGERLPDIKKNLRGTIFRLSREVLKPLN